MDVLFLGSVCPFFAFGHTTLFYYRYACANNLDPLNILNATPEKYATHFTGQVCLHIVSHMFFRIVVNLALHAPSYI